MFNIELAAFTFNVISYIKCSFYVFLLYELLNTYALHMETLVPHYSVFRRADTPINTLLLYDNTNL